MKIRSYFNGTVFKKDLTRFWPLWAIYLAIGLLTVVSNLGKSYYNFTMSFTEALSGIMVLLCIYALIAAQLVFGELFNSRMCNAIHALPVRRESLFFSHFASGMAMGILPNFILMLTLLLPMGRLWYLALLCFLAVSMGYFFFFSVALFCMQCAGSRFAAVAVYALVNLIALMVMWYFNTFYLPMLYGMEMTDQLTGQFTRFSPVVYLASFNDWLPLSHDEAICPINHNISSNYRHEDCLYVFEGLGNGWGYLAILTVLAVAITAATLLLYRRRHLESAGDFIAFQPVMLPFTLMGSTFVGLIFFYIASYVGLIVGMFIGFFACRMLLERTLKVFGKRNWLRLGAMLTAVILSLGLTAFDAFGVASRIPDPEDVESVTIADHYLWDSELDELSMEQSGIVTVAVDPSWQDNQDGVMTIRNTDVIREVTKIHQLLLQEGDAREENGDYRSYATITICYRLKNGSTILRYYYPHTNSESMDRIRSLTNTPKFLLGFENAADMARQLEYAYIEYNDNFQYMEQSMEDVTWKEKLVNALFADAAEGKLDRYTDKEAVGLRLEYSYDNGKHGYQYISITTEATNTMALLKEYEQWCKDQLTADPAAA